MYSEYTLVQYATELKQSLGQGYGKMAALTEKKLFNSS